MKLYLVDTNAQVCDAFRKYFGKYDSVQVFQCPFQELPEFDCMVSPANSFGSMSGGVDLHIRNFFGKDLETSVQEYIRTAYYGEQPVGTSFIVETKHPKHPYLAHTPTMRLPMDIRGRDNVYNAMRGLMIALLNFNKANDERIKTVACTGFGTMVGKMDPEKAIGQMELAYRSFMEPTEFNGFYSVWEREEELKALMGESKPRIPNETSQQQERQGLFTLYIQGHQFFHEKDKPSSYEYLIVDQNTSQRVKRKVSVKMNGQTASRAIILGIMDAIRSIGESGFQANIITRGSWGFAKMKKGNKGVNGDLLMDLQNLLDEIDCSIDAVVDAEQVEKNI